MTTLRSLGLTAFVVSFVACTAAHASFIDDFSTSHGSASITFSGRGQSINAASPWAPFDPTVRLTFAQNFAGTGSNVAASSEISGGSLNLSLKSGLSTNGAAGVGYTLNSFNAGSLDRFQVVYTLSSASNIGIGFYLEDMAGNSLLRVVTPSGTGTGVTQEVLFSSLNQLSGSGFNFSAIKTVSMYFTVTTGSLSADQTISVDTFGSIPTPGAVALLGLAGLTGRRRR